MLGILILAFGAGVFWIGYCLSERALPYRSCSAYL